MGANKATVDGRGGETEGGDVPADGARQDELQRERLAGVDE